MTTRNVTVRRTHKNATTRSRTLPLRYSALIVLCSIMLVIGFFFAARQHFASIEYGIKNSALRKQLTELESEKRRLLLAKEVSLSPAEIKKAARRIGFTESNDLETASAAPVKASIPAAKPGETANHVKTIVISKPAQVSMPLGAEKVISTAPQASRIVAVRDRRG